MVEHLLLDVFTDSPFEGNPLAVFIDPGNLSDRLMAAIARELNLSESVFVWSPGAVDQPWRTRIFTPGGELPFAGHPTIGAAFALAATGRLPIEGDRVGVVLDEAAGPVPVEVECSDGRPARCRFTAPRRPERGPAPDRAGAATAAGLAERDLHPGLAPSTWSAGVAFTVVPVRDLDALARSRPAADADHLYLVCPDGDPATASEWRARMYAPALGITEDPATGAAAAAVAGLLATLDPARAAERTWTIHQGVEMGRPSRIDVTVRRDGTGEISAVEVAGAAVVVGSGRIDPTGGTMAG